MVLVLCKYSFVLRNTLLGILILGKLRFFGMYYTEVFYFEENSFVLILKYAKVRKR